MRNTVPCYLRTARRKWGLTQIEVSSLLNKARHDRISRLERGCVSPTAEELLAFVMIFGVRAEALFPAFYVAQEEYVLDGAYRLSQLIEDEDTPLNNRKRQFIQAIFGRSVEGVKLSRP